MSTTNILDLNNRIDKLSDSVTSVEEALDALKIKTLTVTGTTDAYGRLNIESLAGINAAIIHAYSLDQSYFFIPYRYNSSGGSIAHYLKTFRSDTTAYTVIASTSITVTIYYIDLP